MKTYVEVTENVLRRTEEYNLAHKKKKVRFFRIAIIITLMFMLLTVTAFAFKESFSEFFVKTFKRFTEITFSEEGEVITEDSEAIIPLYPQYIPEGFELISQVETDSIVKRIYENGTSILSYSQTAKAATNLVINTEDTTSEKIYLSNQTEAMYTKNQNIHHLVFVDEKYIFTITISKPYEKDDVIKVANSIKSPADLKNAVSYNKNSSWGGGNFKVENGKLYAKGTDSHGFLGDEYGVYYKEWAEIRNVNSTNIVHLDVCSGTLIYMTEDGKVFGMGSTEGVFTEESYGATDEHSRIRSPQLLMEDCKYASIGTGFVLFLKNDDTLWFTGASKNGQSTRIANRIETPVQIADRVVFCKAFGYTSAWITEQNELFLVGDNSYGQIGNGHKGCGFPTLYKDIVTTPYLALTDCIGFTIDGTYNSMVEATKMDGTKLSWGNNPNPALLYGG